MVNIPERRTEAYDKNSVLSINQMKIQGALDRNNVMSLNIVPGMNQHAIPSQAIRNTTINSSMSASQPVRNATMNGSTSASQPVISDMKIPPLVNVARKGQKLPLENAGKLSVLEARLGWNIKNPDCDLDVSAFLLSGNRVPGDDWFVFYGQPESPDKSTVFSNTSPDREMITINFRELDSRIDKIVFVLTINEALEKNLNFSMVKDAYIRLMDGPEIASFMMDEYYDNVTSMMIGEIYKHNGLWKFNAVGNGVARDLAGLCELYGVQVEGA